MNNHNPRSYRLDRPLQGLIHQSLSLNFYFGDLSMTTYANTQEPLADPHRPYSIIAML